jgi:UDP-GlcNAc:undecaprenyl-phosphate GlcNAc-1-phosphate transferase
VFLIAADSEPPFSALLMAFGCPLAVALVLTAMLIRLAPRLGLVDLPGSRKVHSEPTPRGGGLAIYVAMLIAVWVGTMTGIEATWKVILVGGLIALIGLLDDLKPLPWYLRLGAQMLIVGWFIHVGESDRSWYFKLLGFFWVVGLINAFNMLDNMDALSAGVAWIVAGMLAMADFLHRPQAQWSETIAQLMLMGALSGFLFFNRSPAKIFMGDAGSTFLGFYLGMRSLDAPAVSHDQPATWVMPLCVLSVAIYDMTSVIILRLWQGKSPFHADKQHLSHRLHDLGLPKPAAVRVIYFLTIASGLSGVVAVIVPSFWTWLILVQVFFVWCAVAAVEYVRHFRVKADPNGHAPPT